MKKLLFSLLFLGLLLCTSNTKAETLLHTNFSCYSGNTCIANQYQLVYMNGTTPVGVFQAEADNNSGNRYKVFLTGFGDQVIASDFLSSSSVLDSEFYGNGIPARTIATVRGEGAYSNYIYINYPTNTTCSATFHQRTVLKFDIVNNLTSTLGTYCSTASGGSLESAAMDWNSINNTLEIVSYTQKAGGLTTTNVTKFEMNPTTGASINATAQAAAYGYNPWDIKVFQEVPQKVLVTEGDGLVGNQTFNPTASTMTNIYDPVSTIKIGMGLLFEAEVNTNDTNKMYVLFYDNQSGRKFDIKYMPYNCSNTCTPTDLLSTAAQHRLYSLYQTASGTVFFTYLKRTDNSTYYDTFCPFGDNAFTLGETCSSSTTGICSDGVTNACSSENPGYFCNSNGLLVPLPSACSCPAGEVWQGSSCVNKGTDFNDTIIDAWVDDVSEPLFSSDTEYIRAKIVTDGITITDAVCTVQLTNGTTYSMSYVSGPQNYAVQTGTSTIVQQRPITNYYEYHATGLLDTSVGIHCTKGNIDEIIPIKIIKSTEDYTQWITTLFTPIASNKINDFTIQSGSDAYARIATGVPYDGIQGGFLGIGAKEDYSLHSCLFHSTDFLTYTINPNRIDIVQNNGDQIIGTHSNFEQQLTSASSMSPGTYYYTWLCYNTATKPNVGDRPGHGRANVKGVSIVAPVCSQTTTALTINPPTSIVKNSQSETFGLLLTKAGGTGLQPQQVSGASCSYSINYTSNGTAIKSDVVALNEFGGAEIPINGSLLTNTTYTIYATCGITNDFSNCFTSASSTAQFTATYSACAGTVDSCGLSSCSVCNGTTTLTCNDGNSKVFGETCVNNFACQSTATINEQQTFCKAHSNYYFLFDIPEENTYCDAKPNINATIYIDSNEPAAGINSLKCNWLIRQDNAFMGSLYPSDALREYTQTGKISLPVSSLWKTFGTACVNNANREYVLSCSGSNRQNSTAPSVNFEITGVVNKTISDRRVLDVCIDGTQAGQCSQQQPYFCNSELTLVTNANNKDKKYPVACGCPTGQSSDGKNGCISTGDSGTVYNNYLLAFMTDWRVMCGTILILFIALIKFRKE